MDYATSFLRIMENTLIEGKYGLRDGGREVRREGRWEGRRREGGREVLKIINTLMILQGHGLTILCLLLNLLLYKKSIKKFFTAHNILIYFLKNAIFIN